MEILKPKSLYCHYSQQTEPQDCYVYLDCDHATLRAEYDPEIGGAVTFAVWHNRTKRWHIPALRKAAAWDLLQKIAHLATRIVDGYEARWDGSNHVGTYTEDAISAYEEITDMCQEAWQDTDTHLVVWQAEDWLADASDIRAKVRADSTDEELSDLEDEIDTQACSEGIDIVEDVDKWLRRVRADKLEALDD